MIEIDGSIGYGQVLRTAISLSCLTLKPVRNKPKCKSK
jgi:RNA 3'-terminal phosphate cyclase